MTEESPVAETAPEPDTTEPEHKFDDYPTDHPLVKRLETLKAENKDLKPKARRLAELEEASKSTEEKNAERIAQAEAEVASVPAKVADALRTHLIALHEIDQEDAELFLTATEPSLMLKQVTRLLGQDKRRKNHVPREGQTPSVAAETSDMREFTRQLFGSE
jgi:molecular chaperone GrpE (heat shock protein)